MKNRLRTRHRTFLWISVLITLLGALIGAIANADNGGERHGGDHIIGEYKMYEQVVLARLEKPRPDGSNDKIAKDIKNAVTPSDRLYDVYVRDHACHNYAADGETCLTPADEQLTSIEPRSSTDPSKHAIVWIGQSRWIAMHAKGFELEKEVYARLKNALYDQDKTPQQMDDLAAVARKFYEDHELIDVKWEAFKSQHLAFLRKLVDSAENIRFLNLINIDTFAKSQTDSRNQDWSACQNGDSSICQKFIDKVFGHPGQNDGIVASVMTPAFQATLNEIDQSIVDVENVSEVWRNKDGAPAWESWSDRSFSSLQKPLHWLYDSPVSTSLLSKLRSQAGATEALRSVCPDGGSLSSQVDCIYRQGIPALQSSLQKDVDDFQEAVEDLYVKVRAEAALQIDAPL